MTKINLPKTTIVEWAAFNLSKGDTFVLGRSVYKVLKAEYKEVQAVNLYSGEVDVISGNTLVKKCTVTIDVDYVYQ